MISPAASNAGVAATDLEISATRAATSKPSLADGARRVVRFLVGTSWVINIALLGGACGWVYHFGQSRDIIELVRYEIAPTATSGIVVRDPSRLGIGVTIGLIAVGVAACAWVAMFGSLFAGRSRFRTTRMWLVFTAVTCGWLGLYVGWPTIYWFGQQQRMKAVVPAAEAMVAALQVGWPGVDSTLPDIGPFLAYPIGAPTALLPLSEAMFPKSGLRFSAVERTGDRVIRFELAGAEAGAWLEWRGDGSVPKAFVGGLDSEYAVAQAAKLSPEWFLVRYRPAGLVERGFRSPQSR